MKRIVLSALAVAMLAATSLTGQAAPMNAPVAPQSNYTKVDWQKPGHHNDVRKRVFKKKVVVKRNHWRNGQKYSGWRQHRPIRDYGRYGLHRPGAARNGSASATTMCWSASCRASSSARLPRSKFRQLD